MRVRCIPALCGLAAAALLAACGTNGVHAGTTDARARSADQGSGNGGDRRPRHGPPHREVD